MKPLISCLMVTQPGREPLIREAVACFRRQIYKPRELVIVHDAPQRLRDNESRFLRFLQAETASARIVRSDGGRSLGELRNVALEAARGDVLCQWDDDDQYHPDRLVRQWEAMREAGADACFLASQLHYFARSRELYVRDAGRRGIEGTVMHRRALPVRYPAMGKEEDTVFMRDLVKRFKTTVLDGAPWLYLRVFHGGNTWDEGHHRRMMRSAWEVNLLRKWREEIARQVESYEIERPVTVRGRNGRAFRISQNEPVSTIGDATIPTWNTEYGGPRSLV